MNNKTPKPSAITSHSRAVRQRRIHGPNAKCRDCGERDPSLLVAGSHPKRCEGCYRERKGRSTIDDHHPAGHVNSEFSMPVVANMHRKLTDLQTDWPLETLQNPSGCPLRRAAACLRGFVETFKEMAHRLLFWVIDLLEAASDWFLERYGPNWWIGSPLERWADGQT